MRPPVAVPRRAGGQAVPGADVRPSETGEDRRYLAVRSRDRRFDGTFFTAVRTTGIYCRPSCPAVTPKPGNVTFYLSAAAAQQAGYRACRRCAPDATPGSPEWDFRADVAGRAMRLLNDGLVEREGVPGLARRLGYTPRHLGRLLVDELGASPLALARARRAQTARVLIETTRMPFADIAFAAGFGSVRQFNETVNDVFACSPSQLRGGAQAADGTPDGRRGAPTPGRRPSGEPPALARDPGLATGRAQPGGEAPTPDGEAGRPPPLQLRLAVREPMDWASMLAFLAGHAVAGVEAVDGEAYLRTLSLPRGPALVRLQPHPDDRGGCGGTVMARLELSDLRDLAPAVERCRRLLDLDADPAAVGEHLGADPLIGHLVRARPGLRVPGHPDGAELAIRAVVGQQVSVASAHAVLRRIVAEHGADAPWRGTLGPPGGGRTAFPPGDQSPVRPARDRGGPSGIPVRLFPAMTTLAALDPDRLPMTRARARAVVGLAQALADQRVVLDRSADRGDVRRSLLAVPGVGPWTADVILMRALGDPDVFLPSDHGVRTALRRLGTDPADRTLSDRWRPWRSYALAHLWRSLS